MTPVAAFGSPFRLYRRQEIILSGGNMKPMLIAGASLITSLAMAQNAGTTYSVQDLGLLGGSPGSPYFMANNGPIAGAAGAANNQSHAAVWFMGFKLDLGTPGLGGPNSLAYALNDRGQAVGAAENTIANSEDFCGFNAYGVAKSSTACQPFVFQNGVMTKLPTLGGPNGVAYSINNRSEAVGWAETTSKDPHPACGVLQFQPVLWGTTSTRTLPTFPGDPGGAAASINDNGQVVGATGTCDTFNPNSGLYLVEKHAMLWEAGAAINLGNLGGDGLFGGHHACSINNRSQVVGHSDLTGDSTAISINDSGVIVGVSLDSNFNERAFVWASGSTTDLNAVLTSNPQKLYLLQANSINASGEIVGVAATANGDLHGFLAIPDGTGNVPPLERTASPTPLSEDARKTALRRIGIRGK
jgi:probable HAF family extracellular repeat protein